MGTSLPSSVFWFVVGFVLPSALLLAVVVAGVLGLVGAGCSEVGGAVAEGVWAVLAVFASLLVLLSLLLQAARVSAATVMMMAKVRGVRFFSLISQ